MCEKIVYLSAMVQKVSPELLVEHQGELGLWKSTKKGREFDVLLNFNFNFNVTIKVDLGEQLGSRTVLCDSSLRRRNELCCFDHFH